MITQGDPLDILITGHLPSAVIRKVYGQDRRIGTI